MKKIKASACKNQTLNKAEIKWWFKYTGNGQEPIENDPYSEKPLTRITVGNAERVYLICANRQTAARELAEEIEI